MLLTYPQAVRFALQSKSLRAHRKRAVKVRVCVIHSVERSFVYIFDLEFFPLEVALLFRLISFSFDSKLDISDAFKIRKNIFTQVV